MAKISFAGWKDPARRPRYIIWTGAVVLCLAAIIIVALGATSSYWFCANVCHKVQDDSIIAYNNSSHSKVSCMACHMPVGANPVIFILHKAEALGELYKTVTNNFELPLNGESEVALEMKSTQCTQCHSDNRVVNASPGIIIDHEVHAEKNINCTICHNRIAHNEIAKLTLTNPQTKEPNKRHAQFITMNGCFRCHSQGTGGVKGAGGECSLCHTPEFDLVPASHKTETWFPAGHAEAADEADKKVEEAKAEASKTAEGAAGEAEPIAAESGDSSEAAENPVEKMIPFGEVNECDTCHNREVFCDGCHGMPMPHPAEFKEPKTITDPAGHPEIAKAKFAKCVMCHQPVKTQFCNECHHGKQIGYEYVKTQPWITQHPKGVAKAGIKTCTGADTCHTFKFCSDCHTKRKVFPASHRQVGWTNPIKPTVTVYGQKAATPSAKHAVSAQQSIESCQVCHGSGGPNAKFCKSCHRYDMPHPAEFKEFHSKTGRKSPGSCQRCHRIREICSNCHHIGSSLTRPWIQVHGASVAKNGTTTCLEKCHQRNFCVKCHQARKVVPASHRARRFVNLPTATLALHVQLYQKDSSQCTLCHAGDPATLPNSKYCKSCHKIDMPHPDGFGPPEGEKPTKDNGGQHKELITSGKVKRAVCFRCHTQLFCDQCHHQGMSPKTPWLRQHPTVVKKDGATPCFECHEETFCSHCHVRLNQ